MRESHSQGKAHLDVHDLDRSLAFYRDVVGLGPAHRSEERTVASFWIGGRGRSMLGLWAGSSSPSAPPRLRLGYVTPEAAARGYGVAAKSLGPASAGD